MSQHPPNPLRRERLLAGLGVVEAGEDVEHYLAACIPNHVHYRRKIWQRFGIFSAAQGDVQRSFSYHFGIKISIHSRCDECSCKGVGTLVQQSPHAATTHWGAKQISVLSVGTVGIELQQFLHRFEVGRKVPVARPMVVSGTLDLAKIRLFSIYIYHEKPQTVVIYFAIIPLIFNCWLLIYFQQIGINILIFN